VGDPCVLGALGALYATIKGTEADRLFLKPFPRAPQQSDQPAHNTQHREDLLSRVGSVIVVSGNRDDGSGGVTNSPGVFEEVDIAKRLGKFIIPIGATGHAAHEVWKCAMKSTNQYLPGLAVAHELETLGNSAATNEQLLNAVFAILAAAERVVAGH
jgi:hypothetical protein